MISITTQRSSIGSGGHRYLCHNWFRCRVGASVSIRGDGHIAGIEVRINVIVLIFRVFLRGQFSLLEEQSRRDSVITVMIGRNDEGGRSWTPGAAPRLVLGSIGDAERRGGNGDAARHCTWVTARADDGPGAAADSCSSSVRCLPGVDEDTRPDLLLEPAAGIISPTTLLYGVEG